MTPAQQTINRFLMEVFNGVLRLEEESIAKGKHKNLSVSEVHVLEAVQNATEGQSMSDMAASLRVTPGTFTIAVKTLEQKGFLLRTKQRQDKRRVTVKLTEAACEALVTHTDFHRRLVENVSLHLTEEETENLSQMLCSLGAFFAGQ